MKKNNSKKDDTKKVILISPIGTSDPTRGDFDGPMLHIARHYKPDKIYLLLTNKMKENEDNDQRYTKAINGLYHGEKDNKELSCLNKEVEIIIKDEYLLKTDDPSDFDFFTIFHSIIEKIINENANKENEFYVNISSGTPQMIAALCLDIVNSERKVKLTPVQVKTFSGGSNIGIEPETTAKEFKNNFDNFKGDEIKNRTVEPKLNNFKHYFYDAKIKSFIKSYSYKECMKLILFEQDYQNIKDLCKFCADYVSLRKIDANGIKIMKKLGLTSMDNDNNKQQILCGYNNMVAFMKNNVRNFSLMITPVLFKLCVVALSNHLHDIVDVGTGELYVQNIINNRSFNNKVPEDIKNEWKDIYERQLYVTTQHLIDLINIFEGDITIKGCINELRNVERKVRNKAAHSVVHISEEDFLNWTKDKKEAKEPVKVLKIMKNLIEKLYIDLTDNDFNVFKCVNERIENELDIILKMDKM